MDVCFNKRILIFDPAKKAAMEEAQDSHTATPHKSSTIPSPGVVFGQHTGDQ